MKAISLRQPWAWLVAEQFKSVEFRSRPSLFRGDCYIHAAKTFDYKGYEWISKHPALPGALAVRDHKWEPKADPEFGVIIGKMKVVDCLIFEEALAKYPDDIWIYTALDTLGKYVFIIRDAIHFPVEKYIPCRGKVFPLFFDLGGLVNV